MTKKEKKDIKKEVEELNGYWWYANNWEEIKEQFQNYNGTWEGVNYKR